MNYGWTISRQIAALEDVLEEIGRPDYSLRPKPLMKKRNFKTLEDGAFRIPERLPTTQHFGKSTKTLDWHFTDWDGDPKNHLTGLIIEKR